MVGGGGAGQEIFPHATRLKKTRGHMIIGNNRSCTLIPCVLNTTAPIK